MRTMMHVAITLSLLAPVVAGARQQPDWSKIEITTTKLGGNVYLLSTGDGNSVACLGPDGIVLVDTQFAELVGKIRAALQKVATTDKPVRFVINTHYHYDHVGGNQAFGETATIIAHRNVRRRLQAGGSWGNGGSVHGVDKPMTAAALPTVTFDQEITLHLNSEEIRVVHFPAGHTDGDAIVWFSRANVVHMGDEFVRYGFPFVDIQAGGSVQGMIAALDQLIAQLPADVRVIPGHGQVATLDDVREYVKMLKDTSAVVEQTMKAGRTLDEMKRQEILARWQKLSNDFISTDAFIETLYNSLKK